MYNNQNQKSAFTRTEGMHDLVKQALEPTRQYQQKVKRKQNRPELARFKLKFYFKDGGQSVHYSYDTQPHTENGFKKMVTDENIGWLKLLRCVDSDDFRGKFISAMIWCKQGDRPLTAEGGYNLVCAKIKSNGHLSVNLSMRFRFGRLDFNQFIEMP